MSVYINSAAQISLQTTPLGDEWFENPAFPEGQYHRAAEASYREFLDPIASRRMGRVLKRAVATSVTALRRAALESVDAIITGTGLGCLENSEKFLTAMAVSEELLQPTFFINSTHNTISSAVAVHLKCHGYNSSYVHRGLSFESALLDAFMQFETGRIGSALVGGHDELTPEWFSVLERLGVWKEGAADCEALRRADTPGTIAGETAVSLVLSTCARGAMAEVRGVELAAGLAAGSLAACARRACGGVAPDLVMTGRNGDDTDRRIYDELCEACASGVPQGWWKHVSGESYTSAAFGLYDSALALQRGRVPDWMVWSGAPQEVKNILVVNHFCGEEYSFVMLSAC